MGNAKRVLLYQMLAVLILTGVGLLFEVTIAISLLVGSTISILGTALLALGIFGKTSNQQNPAWLLQRFYIAEMIKVFVIVIAFTLAFFIMKKANFLIVAGAYFITQFVATALASLQSDDI